MGSKSNESKSLEGGVGQQGLVLVSTRLGEMTFQAKVKAWMCSVAVSMSMLWLCFFPCTCT